MSDQNYYFEVTEECTYKAVIAASSLKEAESILEKLMDHGEIDMSSADGQTDWRVSELTDQQIEWGWDKHAADFTREDVE